MANDPTLAAEVATAVSTALEPHAHEPDAEYYPHHHPRFRIDERAMQLAIATYVQIALQPASDHTANLA